MVDLESKLSQELMKIANNRFFNSIPLLLSSVVLVGSIALYFSYLNAGLDWTSFWHLKVCEFVVNFGGGSYSSRADVYNCANNFSDFMGLMAFFGILLLVTTGIYYAFKWIKNKISRAKKK